MNRDGTESWVGLIGVGRMGGCILPHLLEGQYSLRVFDTNEARVAAARRSGVSVASCPAEVASTCSVVLLSLPSPEAVCAVVTGRGGLLSSGCRGSVVVDLSTNSPATTRILGTACRECGNGFLDAPITGGILGAQRGDLTVMVGGLRADVERVTPVLATFAKKIVHVGQQGDGASLKLLHNMLGEIQVYAIAEAFCFAAKLGLDLDRVYEVLANGMSTSRILTELYANGALQRKFEPMATVSAAEKDQRLLLDMAAGADVGLTFSPLVYEKIHELLRRGLAESDVTSAILLFEELYGVKVRVSDACFRPIVNGTDRETVSPPCRQ